MVSVVLLDLEASKQLDLSNLTEAVILQVDLSNYRAPVCMHFTHDLGLDSML